MARTLLIKLASINNSQEVLVVAIYQVIINYEIATKWMDHQIVIEGLQQQ